MESHDEALEKIAVVGPSEHEDHVMMFVLAPMRAGRVRYFSSESEARVWPRLIQLKTNVTLEALQPARSRKLPAPR